MTGTGRDETRVVVPAEPPELGLGAARALLVILRKAAARQTATDLDHEENLT